MLNGEYVLIFGGLSGAFTDIVWIYCVDDQPFTKSKIKCPIKGKFDAVAICDRTRNKYITSGFVRDCWSKCGYI